MAATKPKPQTPGDSTSRPPAPPEPILDVVPAQSTPSAGRGAYLALLVWMAGFLFLLVQLVYDLLKSLFRG